MFTSMASYSAKSTTTQEPKVPQQIMDIVVDTTLPKELKDEARVIKQVNLEWGSLESTIL